MVRNFEILYLYSIPEIMPPPLKENSWVWLYILLKGQAMADRQARLWVTDPLGWVHLAESAKPCPNCSVTSKERSNVMGA
jgi:hypothetical protein